MAEFNEYDALIEQETQSNADQFKGSMYAVESVNPDQRAEALKLAEINKVPVDFVEKNIDAFKSAPTTVESEYDKLINENPRLTEYLSDMDNASLSKDDVEPLKNTERMVKDRDDDYSIMDVMAYGFAGLNKQLSAVPNLAYDAAAWLPNKIVSIAGRPDLQVRSTQFGENPAVSFFEQAQQDIGKKIPELNVSVIDEAVGKGDFSSAGKALAVQVAANAPQQLAILGLAFTGYGGLALTGAGTLSAAEKNIENQKQGVDAALGVESAVITGGLEAAFEKLGTLSGLYRVAKELAKNYGKTTAKQILVNTLGVVAREPAKEGLSEWATSLTQDYADYLLDINPDALKGIGERAVNAGLIGAASGGLMTSPTAGVMAYKQNQEFRRAEINRDFFTALGENAKESKTYQRLPEQYKKYVDQLTANGSVETVYLDPKDVDQYFQSKNLDPAAEFSKIGLLKEYEQAKETGQDISIKTSDMIVKMLNTEHYQGLSGDVKFNADELSYSQAQRQKETFKELFQKEITTEEIQENPAIKDVYDQLIAAGESESVAKEQAKVYRFVDYIARETGQSPESVWMKYGLKIKRGISPTEMPTTDTQKRITKTVVDTQGNVTNYDENVIAKLERDFINAEAGQRISVEGKTIAQESTFPKYAQQLGVKKKDVLNIIEKFKSGKSLTEKQRDLFNQLYIGADDSINQGDLFQSAKYPAEYTAEDGSVSLKSKDVNAYGSFKDIDQVEDEFLNPEGVYSKKVSLKKLGLDGFERFFEIENIQVEEKLQGKGIGSEALKSLEFTAQMAGAEVVVLNASPMGTTAKGESLDELIKFYKKNGYKVARKSKENAEMYKVLDPVKMDEMYQSNLSIDAPIKFQGTGIYRGSYNPRERLIKLFENKDKSTFMHESAHFFLDVFAESANDPNASDKLKQDYAAVLKYLGVEKTEDIKVEQHEKFARSFEAYLREGKAPSLSLKKAFNSFKKWLTKIYPLARQLDVQLTPEIRGVFDRMLATEQEIQDAEMAVDVKPMFKNVDILGLSKEEQEKYFTAIEDARLYAEGKMYSKLEDQFTKKQSKEYKARLDQLTKEAKDVLKENPIYNAIEILSTAKNVDGAMVNKVKIDKGSLQKYGLELDGKFTTGAEGMSVELVAQMFGYDNAIDFINDLNANQPIDQAALQMAEERIVIDFPELFTDPKEDAREALHNSKREDLLRLELEYLLREDLPVFKTAIRKTVRRVPPKAQIKGQAREIIGNLTVGQIKPYTYTRAMVKAAREAGLALAKGDLQAAYDAKIREYLNHELFLAAQEANDTVEKTIKKFKKLDKTNEDLAKTRDIDLINAAKSILSRFGIGQDQKSPLDYLKNLEKYSPEKYDVIKNLIADAVEGAGPYESVSLNDFMEMKKAVDTLVEMAKLEKQSEIDGDKMFFDDIKEQLVNQINTFEGGAKNTKKYKETADDFDQFKTNLSGSLAALKRVEFWADVLDLGAANGPFKRYIFNPISEAGAKYRLKKESVVNDYKKINEQYKDIFTEEPIAADEIGFRFRNKGELLMALLHSGNESNKSKLLRGRGWGFVKEDGSLDSVDYDRMIQRMIQQGVLTKADFDYVQAIWDLNESLKPIAQKAHKDMFGYYFNEITAKEIVTPFGTYKGGYIPAKVDTYENEDAKIRQEREEFEQSGLGMSFMYPTTGKGFTKSRIDAYAAPLSLDLNLLAGHIDASLRFSFIEPRVKEVAKIVYNKEFRAALSKVDKNAGSEVLIPWLQRSASQQVSVPSTGYFKVIDRGAAYLRSAVSMQIMVGNVSNALQQFTGVIVAASKVKPRYMLSGLTSYIKDVKGQTEAMLEKSEYMRSTQGNKLFEAMQRIEQITTNPSVFENARNFAKEHTYFLQTATQNVVNNIVWTGAYNQAIAEGMTEKQAIKAADRTIRTTQGSVLAEDISAFEVGSPTYRLFTQFAGYFNMLANLNSSELQKIQKTVGLKKGAGKAMYVYLTAFMVPAVISDIIVKGMRGEFGEGDDEELMMTWLDSFFGSQFRTATAMTPIAGALANTVVGKFTDQPFDDRLSLSPVLSVLEGAAGVPFQVYKGLTRDEVNEKKVTKDVLMLSGVLTNLPLAPLGKPLGYLIDVEQGKARPTGPIDFTRGLISGQPGK